MKQEKQIELTKKVLQNCTIYPKSQPKEVQKQITKLHTVLMKSSKDISEKEFIELISKSIDVKQRIKHDTEWIQYCEN